MHEPIIKISHPIQFRWHLAQWLRIGLVFSSIFLGISTQALEQKTLILSTAWWQDHSGQASLQEAKNQTYTPYYGIFNRGYSDTTHWLRLTLDASDKSIGLRFTPLWIDEITLYDPAVPDHLFQAGDLNPESNNAQQSLGYVFILPASPHPRDVLLRLKSTSTHRLKISAVPLDELLAINTKAIFWTALYIAIIVMVLISLIVIWKIRRERILGIYLVKHSSYVLYSLFFLGVPAQLISAEVVPAWVWNIGLSVLVTTAAPTGLWFEIALLKTYRPQRHLLLALQCIAWISLLPLGILLIGETRIALELTASLVVLITILIFITGLSTRPDKSVEQLMPKKILMGYYTLAFGSMLVGVSSVLGWFHATIWTEFMPIAHGLVSGLVMAIILLIRSQRLQLHHQNMEWQLNKVQQDMEFEKIRSQEQSQFLHMLMHELKTPLSVVSAALGTRKNREENLAHAGRAVQDMKAIIERCVQADQLGDLTLRQHRDTVELLDCVEKLADNIPRLGSRLQLQADSKLTFLKTDKQLLQVVLTNLLDNASRYSDLHSPIIVQLTSTRHQSKSGLQVRVSNTPGLAGWPDETQIFTKYYRAAGARRDSGSGLGLYLSRQLAYFLGGTLDYNPTSQHVEFILWIPQTSA
jgi:signal transduction histidine kinase